MLFKRILIACTALMAAIGLYAKESEPLHVIPYPQSVEMQKGSFKARGAQFNCDPSVDPVSQTGHGHQRQNEHHQCCKQFFHCQYSSLLFFFSRSAGIRFARIRISVTAMTISVESAFTLGLKRFME